MADSKGEIVVYEGPVEVALAAGRGGGSSAAEVPAIVRAAGAAAGFAWDEFFEGELANPHTRKAYSQAVRDFLAWAEGQHLGLLRITPGDVGSYLKGFAMERAHEEATPRGAKAVLRSAREPACVRH